MNKWLKRSLWTLTIFFILMNLVAIPLNTFAQKKYNNEFIVGRKVEPFNTSYYWNKSQYMNSFLSILWPVNQFGIRRKVYKIFYFSANYFNYYDGNLNASKSLPLEPYAIYYNMYNFKTDLEILKTRKYKHRLLLSFGYTFRKGYEEYEAEIPWYPYLWRVGRIANDRGFNIDLSYSNFFLKNIGFTTVLSYNKFFKVLDPRDIDQASLLIPVKYLLYGWELNYRFNCNKETINNLRNKFRGSKKG